MNGKARWNRIQGLCEEVERRPEEERESFLAQVESDAGIRAEVMALVGALRDEEQARREYVPAERPAETRPRTIGAYTIQGYLGRGGTGTVYAAEIDRAGVKQQVAVKVLHARLDDGETEERFRREQRMLAQLDHPGITRVIDAGVTEEQQPYLVMDRVAGEPIDVYCDRQRLDVAGRVRLLVQVCEAVAAAHRALIVHLDLKPSNLLVTEEGRAKLLDFGTAKLVRPGDLTMTRQMTPLYASPEQLRGEAVTTACDVYSLGVVLYEVLTGEWPFGSRESMLAVWERAAGETSTRKLTERLSAEVAEQRGMRLEQLREALRGDLEVIVSKAMAGRPEERYESVAALAEDLQRLLEQRPVLARKQTAWYQLGRYAARHRGVVSLTLLLVVGLSGAVGYGWWQQRQALRAARVAEETGTFLNWMVQSSRPMYGGRTEMTVRELVQKAGKEIEARTELSDLAAVNLLQSFGSYLAEAGDAEGGMTMLRKAEGRATTAEERIGVRMGIATMLIGRGKCEEAMVVVRQVEAEVAKTKLEPMAYVTYLTQRSESMDTCEARQKDIVTLLAPLPGIVRQIPSEAKDKAMRTGLFKALAMNTYAVALYSAGRYDEAMAVVNEAMGYAGTGPDTPGVRVALYRTISYIEQRRGNLKESAAALGECVRLGEGYTSTFEFLRLKVMWATKLALTGEKERPVRLAQETIAETHRRAAEIGPARWMILVDSSMALMRAGACAEVPGLLAEADSIVGKSMGASWRGNRLSTEGFCLLQMGKKEEGRKLIRETLAVMQPLWVPGSKFKKELEDALR